MIGAGDEFNGMKGGAVVSLSVSESVSKRVKGSGAGGDRVHFRESKLASLECGEGDCSLP